MHVHLLNAPEPLFLRFLEEILDSGVEITTGSEIPPESSYEILVAGRPEDVHVKASTKLHTLIIPWAGLPVKTRELMLQRPDIAVHNLHHNAGPAAEMALSLLLAAAKLVVPMDRALRAHDWRPRYEPDRSVLLDGKTALIVGYGAVGARVALMCRGLGLSTVAVSRSGGEGEVYPVGALHDLLPRANALILCLPLTSETEEMIGEEELALLPERALLVNVGRGPVVGEAALYKALKEGKLHGAGLDVWFSYPKNKEERGQTAPSAYPFEDLDNVVMSPHRGGAFGTDELERKRMKGLADLINFAMRGKPLPNRVNLEQGY